MTLFSLCPAATTLFDSPQQTLRQYTCCTLEQISVTATWVHANFHTIFKVADLHELNVFFFFFHPAVTVKTPGLENENDY